MDGIDDIGLFVPKADGSNSAGLASWFWLISDATQIPQNQLTGTLGAFATPLVPLPFGNDLALVLGDGLALPVVGNFDPPISGGTGSSTSTFSDAFDRSDANTLGSSWTPVLGQYGVGNAAAVPGSTDLSLAVVPTAVAADVTVSAMIDVGTTGSQHGGLVARYCGPEDGSMYLGALVNNNGQFSAQIWCNLAGSWAQLGSAPVDSGAGDLRFDVQGSSLRLYFNEHLAVDATDDSLRLPGAVGIRGVGGVYDSFGAESLTGTLQSWSGETLTPQFSADGLAIATLQGASAVDADLTANVDVGSSGFQHSGLVARYSGSGDQDMYLGALVNSDGAYCAQIWRNLGGQWSQLSSAPAQSGYGKLRFVVQGSALSLYFDSQLATSAVDGAISTCWGSRHKEFWQRVQWFQR